MKALFRKWIRDTSAQTTVEYIVLLAVAVSFTLILINGFIRPAMNMMSEVLQGRIDRFLKNKDSLHRFPLGGGRG